MRSPVAVLVVAACGRTGFDAGGDGAVVDTDAPRAGYRAGVLADSPAHYFRLDEAAGPYAADTVASGVMGLYSTTNNMIRFGQAGALGEAGTAVQFDNEGNFTPAGDTALIEIAPPPALLAQDFTIEALVHPIGQPSDQSPYSFFLCEDYMSNGFRTGWLSNMRVRVWNDEAGGTGSIVSQRVLTSDTWQHVAITRSGPKVGIFIDGVDAGGGMLPDYTPPGTAAECGAGSFHGMPSHVILDELALYPVALDATRIAEHARLAGR